MDWQRLILVRHGQSINTAAFVNQSASVAPAEDGLTTLGQQQVSAMAQTLPTFMKRPPHVFAAGDTTVELYSSPSRRCQETADAIEAALLAQQYRVARPSPQQALAEIKAWDYSAHGEGANVDHTTAVRLWCNAVFERPIDPKVVRIFVTHANALRFGLAQRWGLPPHVQLAPGVAAPVVLDVDAAGRTVVHNLFDNSSVPSARQWVNEDLFKVQ